uniref:FTH domain-containing protein n=1 Tax=Caenorhabditis tropicalis TaxID=1561998 RepID=A0A1I7TAJ2_9PELO
MDPNTRFLLYTRIPSIRTAERAATLRIKELVIGCHCITINGTLYCYAIYQVKDKILCRVSTGGRMSWNWICDVDKFGIPDYITKAGNMLPGNNGQVEQNLFGVFDLENIPTNEGRLQKLEGILEVEKQRYNQLLSYCPKSNQVNDQQDELGFSKFESFLYRRESTGIFNKETLELLNNQEMVEKAMELLDKRVKKMEFELLPFENKRNNIFPEFEIHVSKTEGDCEPCVIERVKYTGEFHKAEDYLRDFMFSKRHHSVVVKNLKVKEQNCPIRMPRDLKLRITNLEVIESLPTIEMVRNVETVKAMIDISSSPLKMLKMSYEPYGGEQLDFEFIKKFEFLYLYDAFDLRLRFIQNIPNRIVKFRRPTNRFLQNQDFLALIRNWVETDKPIGTCFSFFIFKAEEEIAIQVLNTVKNGIDLATVGDKCVNIPMKNSAILKINYEHDENSRLFLKMAVVPVE